MKRSVGLSLILVLWINLSAQAAIYLSPINLAAGDTATFVQQTPGLSFGYGGQFTWQIATTAPRTDGSQAPASGTTFYAFCGQMTGNNSDISNGGTYTVAQIINPAIGSLINKAGNTLVNTQGLFLFDQWANGNIALTQANAAAVQAALWLGEGYAPSTINSNAGFSPTDLASAQSTASSLLTSLGYSPAWQIGPNDNVAILSNGQDEFFYGDPKAGAVPEPASFLIWGVGLSLAGAATVIGAKRTRRLATLRG